MIDLEHQEATYKQHLAHKNSTQKTREDKRTRDLLYESIHEWTR